MAHALQEEKEKMMQIGHKEKVLQAKQIKILREEVYLTRMHIACTQQPPRRTARCEGQRGNIAATRYDIIRIQHVATPRGEVHLRRIQHAPCARRTTYTCRRTGHKRDVSLV